MFDLIWWGTNLNFSQFYLLWSTDSQCYFLTVFSFHLLTYSLNLLLVLTRGKLHNSDIVSSLVSMNKGWWIHISMFISQKSHTVFVWQVDRQDEKLETVGDNVECDSKKGVAEIDDTKAEPRGVEVGWKKKNGRQTFFPWFEWNHRASRVFKNVSHQSWACPTEQQQQCVPGANHWMVGLLNSQFEICGGPQKDRLVCGVCMSGKIV